MRKILIVDDMETNRAVLKKILGTDYDILEARDGKEALQIIHKNHKMLSAVLLDLIMPVMDGYEVLLERQQHPYIHQIPVIVITGNSDEQARIKALSLGANDFVMKPYNPAIIKHCLNNNISLRETASIINAMQKDKLTGIYSREAFFEKAAAEIKSRPSGSFVMACFDIDNFKLINDQYGATEGDRILRHIGNEMKIAFESVGGICGRISGDNFAGIFPNTLEAEKTLTESRLKKFIPHDTHIAMSFSVGRYIISDLSLPVSAMYDRAYIAKLSIKGLYDKHIAYFDDSMLETLVREQNITNEMDSALAKKQFEVWFQPQYNHSTGALIGAEALVRWRHPIQGLIPPGVFIPIFEQNGFVYELDKYVWEQTCIYLHNRIQTKEKPLPLSVNISRQDVFKEDFYEIITGLVTKYEIPIDLLRLEITESAFAKSTEQIIRMVKKLINFGFTIEIDDFGSGYSSLNTLKDVPATVLKLDMRFLESNENSQRGGNILESVVRMAKWLGMTVLAEGVETIEQANFLKSIGCMYVQGYLYARPMPADEYDNLSISAKREDELISLETVENLDNNSFWDPASLDTLIFNSYVGGACIFEFHNDSLELLRANDKFIKIFNNPEITVEAVLKINWEKHLDKISFDKLVAALEKSFKKSEEITEELVFHNLFNQNGDVFLRSSMRVIASTGERYLVYCTSENISAQREAEMREKAASERLTAIMADAGIGITASIIYDNSVIELIFANEKYYEIIGYTKEQYEVEVTNPYILLHPTDGPDVARHISEAYYLRQSDELEYRIIRRDGKQRWVRAILSETNFTGVGRTVQLCMLSDITAEKQAQHELRATDEQIRFLNTAAHDLLAQTDTSIGIENTLKRLLEYFNAARSYVFEFDFEKSTVSNTYEVCGEGVKSEKQRFQNISFEHISFLLHTFEKKDYINIPDVNDLSDDRPEKQLLKAQNVTSLVAVPMLCDGRCIGFIGVDDIKHHSERVGRLKAVGDYIAVTLTRRDMTAKIENDRLNLQALMNDTPGGFVRMQVLSNNKIVPLYFNDGFLKLMKMTRTQAFDAYSNDVFKGVHSDDIKPLQSAIFNMIKTGKACNVKYRIMRADKSYIRMMIFGRITKNEKGDVFLNVYYTDATEQHKAEQMKTELLDNMPCGAALFEVNGEKIKIVHLNKRYIELIGRDFTNLHKIKVENAVHPDDKEILLSEMELAIQENRELECELRILGTEGAFLPFRVTARIISRNRGKISVYAIFFPLSNEQMTYQEMLPIALSTLLESSSDITFIKDREHRYISGSLSFAKMAGVSSISEIIGKTDFDLLDKKTAQKYLTMENEIFSTGMPYLDYDEQLNTANGETIYASTSKYPLKDANGNVIGVYGISRDTTAMHNAFDKLQILTESIPGGIAAFELCNGQYKMVYFNEGMYEFSGYSKEEYEKQVKTGKIFLVFDEDISALSREFKAISNGEKSIIDCEYRCHKKDGGYRWFSMRGKVTGIRNDVIYVYIVQFDITEQKQAEDELRISKEHFRIAASLGDRSVARYDIINNVFHHDSALLLRQGFPYQITNAMQTFENAKAIDEGSVKEFRSLYTALRKGKPSVSATVLLRTPGGVFRWFRLDATTIFDIDKKPSEAIVVFSDVTEQREKETVYTKWQQSLRQKEENCYTLFQCNLSKNTSYDTVDGSLLKIKFRKNTNSFNERTLEYAEQFVVEEDRDKYISMMNSDALLAGYYRGVRTKSLEYREITNGTDFRWLRISVELVEYPDRPEVKAYLMYENIDADKKAALETLERAETDSLTGVLNRASFCSKMEEKIKKSGINSKHALLMLDIDGFKQINDAFGHTAGDQMLIDTAKAIRSVLRSDDLIGRLGGDEFIIFLHDIPNDFVISERAQKICNLTRKSFSVEVSASSSIGIVVCPRDGSSFDELYKKADYALYFVKGSGKNGYAFYHKDMMDETIKPEYDASSSQPQPLKPRMLIVDDSDTDYAILNSIFKNDFIIDRSTDGNLALVRLRHYGKAISVVLLDMIMPGISGLKVLEKMQENSDLASIPVIVVSADESRETNLNSIRCGASDFITKPVDVDLLRTRVFSAVSKAENERLRTQNNYLQLQSNEVDKYRTVLSHTGICVIEYDWINSTFSYDSAISSHIAGIYDSRKLWRILLSDMVADTSTVRRMQEYLQKMASDHECMEGRMLLQLKTPSMVKHWFEMKVYKQTNEFQLANKFILAFTDLGKELDDKDTQGAKQ